MTPAARLAVALRWVPWLIALALIYLRATVGIEPFPYWDVDPMRLASTPSGLTPAWSQAVDAGIIAASGLALLGECLAGLGAAIIPALLILAGSLGVLLHAYFLRGGSLEDSRIGTTWVASAAAALAAIHISRDDRLRRITAAASIALIIMLAAKGVLQYTVEHAANVAQYRANPDSFLASQGWAPGSPQARAFARRLEQNEATGWFGLSNVFASFAAASFIALTGWTFLAWRRARDGQRALPDGWAGVITLGALAAAAALLLAGSKGGTTAAGVGLALLAAGMILNRQRPDRLARIFTPRAGGLLAIGLILSALILLIARGAVGERVGELSLLFRWFYVQGAARIFAHHPGFGVGPAGFKDAYMIAKPPQSPEEVQSPHSIFFDYAATLGAFGLAWAAFWLYRIYRAGAAAAAGIAEPSLPSPPPAPPTADRALSPARLDGWAMLLLIAAPSLISAFLERTISTPDSALARLLGLIGWLGLALAVLNLMRLDRAWRWIFAVAALALALHGQIEVTPVWPGSAALAAVLIAIGGEPVRAPSRRWSSALAAAALLAVSCIIAIRGVQPTARWESNLAYAAAQVSPLAEFSSRLEAVTASHGQSGSDSMTRIALDISAAAGTPPITNPAELDHAMNLLASRLATLAMPPLEAAAALEPSHLPTTESLCRLKLAAAGAEAALGHLEVAAGLGEDAARRAEKFVAAQFPHTAGAYAMLGTVWSSRAEIEHRKEYLSSAVLAWSEAAALDPYGVTFPLRTARALELLNRHDEARSWAQRTLDRNALQRLDPLKGLTPEDRSELTAILGRP